VAALIQLVSGRAEALGRRTPLRVDACCSRRPAQSSEGGYEMIRLAGQSSARWWPPLRTHLRHLLEYRYISIR